MRIPFSKLKSGGAPPEAAVWAVAGEEDLSRRDAIRLIEDRHTDPSFADFDCDTVSGSSLDAARVLASWQTIPLGTLRRVVTVRDLQEASTAEIQKLADAVDTPCERGCLIIEAASDTTKEIKTLLKTIEKTGVVVICASAKKEDARAFLLEEAARLNVTIQAGAAEEMLRRLGSDLWQISNETRKLSDHAWPETTIRRSDVDKLIQAAPEDHVFQMIDALCDGRTDRAAQMLDGIFRVASDDRSAAHRTLALLVRHFRLLWQARVLRDSGFGFRDAAAIPAPAAAMLPASPNLQDVLKRQSFLMSRFRSQAERFSLTTIEGAFDLLADTDLALKGRAASVGDPRGDLEMCLWRLGLLASTTRQPGPGRMNFSG